MTQHRPGFGRGAFILFSKTTAMFKVHGYLDEKLVINWRMEHLPRTGDTVRFAEEKYAKVTEVIWCLDEKSNEGQRVNVRMETTV